MNDHTIAKPVLLPKEEFFDAVAQAALQAVEGGYGDVIPDGWMGIVAN